MSKLYDEKSIESLSPLEFTRLRPGVYAGDTTYSTQLLVEIFSNAVDEFNAGHGDVIDVTIEKDVVTVKDYGQGFICNNVREDGKTILEAAFSVLNTSGKYREDGSYEGTSLGSFGIGSKITTFLSHWLRVTSLRDGQIETIWFKEGVFEKRQSLTNRDAGLMHGTEVQWCPSEEFFTHTEVELPKIKSLFKTVSCLCPGLTINLTVDGKSEKFYSENGLNDLVDDAVGDKEIINNRLIINDTEDKYRFNMVMTYTSNYSGTIVPYVNTGLTDTGAHITQLKTCLTREFNKYLREKKILKDKDENLTGDDIQEGLYIVFNYTAPNVKYDAQVKSRVTGIETKFETQSFVYHLVDWLEANEKEVKLIADKALNARKAREAAKKARDAARELTPKDKKKKFIEMPTKLVDCWSKDRLKCKLLIAEGDSAANGLIDARDSEFDAIMPIRGKIIAAYKNNPEKIFANQEVRSIIKALGLDFDPKTQKLIYDKKKLRYGMILLCADADPDGANIRNLLIELFWWICPELIINGHIYTTMPPLFRITTKKNEYIYLKDAAALEEYKAKHVGEKFQINRNKGLGEQDADELYDALLNEKTRNIAQLTVEDEKEVARLFETLFGPAVPPRRAYLLEHAEDLVEDITLEDEQRDLYQETSDNFIDYSNEFNINRAFADARDGLKPGQRACLWEMYDKGYLNNKPHVKSAKIAGGVIANWWPHSNDAIYDTFARMSQKWINNIPEVDWHGANGSVQISGEPAAMRYTEARLAKVIEDSMLGTVKKHAVQMISNFDETDEWPAVFPALLPRLMVNGCQGIGSTIANVWLPHNFGELAQVIKKYVATGELDYSNLAPDFPSGGIIINQKDIPIIYRTGKGKVVVRGVADIKGNKIIITELPYQTYVEPFIENIKELIIKDELTGISEIHNTKDRKDKNVKIEIECDENPASVLNQLYKKTDLQKSFSANQIALVGKTPTMLTLKDYLNIFIEHNCDCIKNEFTFELQKAKDRLEIVVGLLRALEDIDNIIVLIKASKSSADAVKNLMLKYDFTEAQAKAIVDMKLGRLANLEKVELNEEKEQLTSDIADYSDIISRKERQSEIFITRFDGIVKKYGQEPRKTQLMHIEIKPEEKEIEAVVPEDVMVVMSQSGNVKRIPLASYKVQKRNGKGVKNLDEATLALVSTNTINALMVFTDKGKMYRLLVDNIPEGTNASKGVNVASILKMDADEKVIAASSLYRNTKAKYAVFFTKNGLIKKTSLEEYASVKKTTGIVAIKFKENDSLADVTFLDEEDVVVITRAGMAIHFETKSIAATGRATSGVKAINLNEGDEVITGLPVHKTDDQIAIITINGLGKLLSQKDIPSQGRGGKGVKIATNDIVGAEMVSAEDQLLIMGRPNSICINVKDMPVVGKIAQGNIVINGSKPYKVCKL